MCLIAVVRSLKIPNSLQNVSIRVLPLSSRKARCSKHARAWRVQGMKNMADSHNIKVYLGYNKNVEAMEEVCGEGQGLGAAQAASSDCCSLYFTRTYCTVQSWLWRKTWRHLFIQSWSVKYGHVRARRDVDNMHASRSRSTMHKTTVRTVVQQKNHLTNQSLQNNSLEIISSLPLHRRQDTRVVHLSLTKKRLQDIKHLALFLLPFSFSSSATIYSICLYAFDIDTPQDLMARIERKNWTGGQTHYSRGISFFACQYCPWKQLLSTSAYHGGLSNRSCPSGCQPNWNCSTYSQSGIEKKERLLL